MTRSSHVRNWLRSAMPSRKCARLSWRGTHAVLALGSESWTNSSTGLQSRALKSCAPLRIRLRISCISASTGFRSAGVHCGIKANPAALDLAVLAVDTFASMAGVFTTNLAQAAPVLVSKRHLDVNQGVGCAIVVNSGCANACTGESGLVNARRMAEEVARALGCQPEQILVASTGVIGVGLNM